MCEISIEKALAIAIVRCGMSVNDFSSLSPSEWAMIIEELKHREENEYKDNWERTRQIVFSALRPHISDNLSLEDLFPLPWDKPKEKVGEILTQEEIEQMKQRFNTD